jgi:hypothetical protein
VGDVGVGFDAKPVDASEEDGFACGIDNFSATGGERGLDEWKFCHGVAGIERESDNQGHR